MKKYVLIILVMIFGFQLNAQSNWKEFWKQSTPIKIWVATHPFKAKKAQIISLETKKVTDSISNTNLLDGDKFGGQVDAFRHAFWMAKLRYKIGKCAALSLGRAYERSNKRTYRKNKRNGRNSGYDKSSKEMDLFNNNKGVIFTERNDKIIQNELILQIVNSIKQGELKVIQKDSLGNFTNCNNKPLLEKDLNKWRDSKCLINSNLN